MAKGISAAKAARQSENRRLRNRSIRSNLRTGIRRVRESLVASTPVEDRESVVNQAKMALDKAASKGVIHKGNAARRKSRLTRGLRKSLQSSS